MRTALLIILGMLIMFVILKFLSGKSESSQTTENFKKLAGLQQTANLIKTNEFRELAKTSEFREFVGSLAEDQIIELAKTLT